MDRRAPESPFSLLEQLARSGKDGILLQGEREMLLSPDARQLSPKGQWEWLASNRKVGWWVTALAGGVRVVVLAGGGLAMALFAAGQLGDGAGWPELAMLALGLALVGLTIRMTLAWLRRLSDLRRPLPDLDELGIGLADPPNADDPPR